MSSSGEPTRDDPSAIPAAPAAPAAAEPPDGPARPPVPEPWLSPDADTADTAATAPGPRRPPHPDAVLFERDGTLVADVPCNGDPGWVRPLPGAREALAELRGLGVPVGVVSHQPGVAKGILTRQQVDAVQCRVEQLLGPVDVWAVCPHGPHDGCGCRRPDPGLVLAACRRLGADPVRTVVVGSTGADLVAAASAGARGILVPAPGAREEEADRIHETAPDLVAAVRLALHHPVRRGLPSVRIRSAAPALEAGPADGAPA
ncbi:D-glycero-alpha-D-manno-heptose-1,7-bisphosphate 7-phosphatase [Streptomyces sp. NPDC001380]|uniref:D-glycero-alpha-D-manno-heptose-1,7-bisphosphate 7-phosphatase n=1 Tax=Streptomyces sp. NPDC001380 TaxID=3364566 RepID=UPI0036B0394F